MSRDEGNPTSANHDHHHHAPPSRQPGANPTPSNHATSSPSPTSTVPSTLPEGVAPSKRFRRGLEDTDSLEDTLRMAKAAREAFRWLEDDKPRSSRRPVRLPRPSSAALGRADDEGMIAPPSER